MIPRQMWGRELLIIRGIQADLNSSLEGIL